MSLPVARVGVYLLLSVLAVAGGLVLTRKANTIADREHACWGASAG